jgi:hypothetical protein
MISGNISNIMPGLSFIGFFNNLGPFSGPWQFAIFSVLSFVFIFLLTSTTYFSLHKVFVEKGETEEEDETAKDAAAITNKEYDRIQIILTLSGALAGLLVFLIARFALHSIRVDFQGNWTDAFTKIICWQVILADCILAGGILVIAWGWTRLFQILLLDEIFNRFSKIVWVIPYISASMIITFMTGMWFFYSNIFPLWWYLFSFGIIYGLIYFFSLKDFKKHIKMHLSQSVEFEEELSLKTISIAGGVVLVIGIMLPHLIFHTLSTSYIFSLFFALWLVSMYMTPGKIFRQVKLFPRFVQPGARILNFAKFTRKFLIIWAIILLSVGMCLGAGIVLDPGYKNPHANLRECIRNLRFLGENLEQYLKKNKNTFPSAGQWRSGNWLQKTIENDKIIVPTCPSGGVYILRKKLNNKKKLTFEILCSCGAHRRAGLDRLFPRLDRHRQILLDWNQDKRKANESKDIKS